MTQVPSTPLPWEMEIGEKHCFHNGNRVSIFSRLPDREYPSEAIYQTIAEIWPGDNDVDIKDGKFIMMVCHCHEELLAALKNIVANGALGPDPLWNGATDAYIVSLDDIDQARIAITKVKNFKVETGV